MSTIIKNPLTLFTPATKVVGTDLVVNASEVEVVEEQEEEITSGSFIIRDGGNQINYTFVIDDINNSGLFVEYNNVYDITNSVYIRCNGITSYVYILNNC